MMLKTLSARRSGRRSRRGQGWLAAMAAAVILSVPAFGKIDLVTLPQRDKTQLTIYKTEDLTLVRETRELTFKKGMNEIQFSWANTLIDPTSLQIRFLKESPDFTVLDASYPANTQNTIVWNIEAKKDAKASAEISYFASGLTWRADYTAVANDAETALRLEPDFTITNSSGEDFEKAQTRLVVGEINLVEAIRMLAQRGIIDAERAGGVRRELAKSMMRDDKDKMRAMGAMADNFAAAPAAQAEAKEILKAAVSEYYLYTIEGTEDLKDGWGKQLPNPRVDEIPFDLSYEYNPDKYGGDVVKFYKFKNDKPHKLGETPLPEGRYYVYSGDGRGGRRFQAIFDHKYMPIGEDAELNLGRDGRAVLEQRQMSMERKNFEFDKEGDVRGYDFVESREIEIRNSNGRAVPIKITLNMGGADWEIKDASVPFKKVDRWHVEWKVDVPALDKLVLHYNVITRTGSRDRTQQGYTGNDSAAENMPATTTQEAPQ